MGGWMKLVMGIKECNCCDKYWMMYQIVESLNCTPETNITLYVNYTETKNLKRTKTLMSWWTEKKKVFFSPLLTQQSCHFRRQWNKAENEMSSSISPCHRSKDSFFPTPLAFFDHKHSIEGTLKWRGATFVKRILKSKFLESIFPKISKTQKKWAKLPSYKQREWLWDIGPE